MKFVIAFLVLSTSFFIESRHAASLDETRGYEECGEFDSTISKLKSLDSICDSEEKCAHMTEVEDDACGFGVRRYSGGKWVGTPVVKNDGPKKMYENAFWRLYHYIGRRNDRHAKISMTVPVVTMTELNEDYSEGATVMYFRLPPVFQNNPPNPTDSLVFIQDWPEDKIVYYRAMGKEVEDESAIHREFERLASALTNAGKDFWPYLAVAGTYTLPGRGGQRSEVMFVGNVGDYSEEGEEELSLEKKDLLILKSFLKKPEATLSLEKRDLMLKDYVKIPDIDLEDAVDALSWVEQERKVLRTWAEKEVKNQQTLSKGQIEEKLSVEKREIDVSLEERDLGLVDALAWVQSNVEVPDVSVGDAVEALLFVNKERKVLEAWAEKEVKKVQETGIESRGKRDEDISVKRNRRDINIDDVLMWVNENVDFEDVVQLMVNNVDLNDVLEWVEYNVDPRDVLKWVENNIDFEDVLKLIQSNVEPKDLLKWVEYNVDFEDVLSLVQYSMNPKDALKWIEYNVDPEDLLEWVENNMDFEDMLEWVEYNVDLEDVLEWVENNVDLADVLQWVEYNVDLADVLQWVEMLDIDPADKEMIFRGIVESLSEFGF